MVKMDGNADSEHIQISSFFFRSKKPWREGAKVYYGYQLFENGKRRPVTIKMIDTYRKKHLRKVKRLAKLRHPNIIETIAVVKREGHMYIVMERFDPNNMQSFFDKDMYFPKKSYKNFTWTKQLIDAMQYIYYKGFIVENLTPKRVFFFSEGKDIKVSLFAIEENRQENDLLLVGSYQNDYQAPEMLNSATLSPESNIFTLGTILATLWSYGIHPFGEGAISRMYNIMTNQSRPLLVFFMDATKADEFYDLIRWMLQPDPELRPTIDQVAGHPFFDIQQAVSVKGIGQAEDCTLSQHLTDNILTEKLDSPEGVDVDLYINRLQNAPKSEMLAIFREIFELGDEAQSEIARSIRNADFSGSTLSLYDVHRIGSIINLSKHLDVVNFSSCNLQPGALRLLKDTLTNNVPIDNMQVTGNPGLMVSDLCSGFHLCAQIGCRFVYDSVHSSKKDRKKLKDYIKQYQVAEEGRELRVEETLSGAENVKKETTQRDKPTQDPLRLIEQKFEMTLMGLGTMMNRREKMQLWFDNGDFDMVPQESCENLVEKLTAGLSSLSIEKEESNVDIDSTIEKTVKEVLEDLLHQVEEVVANVHDYKTLCQPATSRQEFHVTMERSYKLTAYKAREGIGTERDDGPLEDSCSGLAVLKIVEEESNVDIDSTMEKTVKEVLEELLHRVDNAMASVHDNKILGQQMTSRQDLVNTIHGEMGRSCKQISYKMEEIDPEGGLIELYGCEIHFPRRAVKKRTKVRISLDIDPDNLPKFATAISPILECKPSRFRVPVLVRLKTWFSAKNGEKIWVTIMSKLNRRARWKEVQKVLLDDHNMVEYKVKHFCGHVTTVPNERASEGVYHLINDVWMHSRSANITLLFCKTEKEHKKCGKLLKTRRNESIISLHREISVSIGNAIATELQCNRPPSAMEIKCVDDNGGRLDINTENLRKNFCSLSFQPYPHPEDMSHVKWYDVRYHTKVFDSDQRLINGGFSAALDIFWPLDSTAAHRIAGEPATGVHFSGPVSTVNVTENTIKVGGRHQDGASASNQNISAPNI